MHGIFGERIGKEFNLAVDSVPEAFHAINTLTNGGWQKLQLNTVEDNLKYNILVNEKELNLESLKNLSFENAHKDESLKLIKNSELNLIPQGGLKSIDIVPAIDGSMPAWFVPLLIMTIIVTVIQLLLLKPPKFDDFREIEDTKKGSSYLFDGPKNTVNEGGPIPLGYGRLVVGSQVIAQTYSVYYQDANDTSLDMNATPTPVDSGYRTDSGFDMWSLLMSKSMGYPGIFDMRSYLQAEANGKPYVGEYNPNDLGLEVGIKFTDDEFFRGKTWMHWL